MGRRERERHNRVEEIIDAAEEIMFTKGYDKTTLVEIARKAEFSRPTLYKYFKTKEEIFLAIHIRGLQIRWEMLKTAMDAVTGPEDKLYAYADAYYKFVKKYPEYIRLQLHWDSFGLNTRMIREDLFAEYDKMNRAMRAEVYRIFQALTAHKTSSEFNIDWAMGHWFYTLRTIANQTVNPLDTLGLYNDPGFYQQYVKAFIKSLTIP